MQFCKIFFFGGGHLEGEDFDENFKEKVEKRIEDIISEPVIDEEKSVSQTQCLSLNRDISLEETGAVIQW